MKQDRDWGWLPTADNLGRSAGQKTPHGGGYSAALHSGDKTTEYPDHTDVEKMLYWAARSVLKYYEMQILRFAITRHMGAISSVQVRERNADKRRKQRQY